MLNERTSDVTNATGRKKGPHFATTGDTDAWSSEVGDNVEKVEESDGVDSMSEEQRLALCQFEPDEELHPKATKQQKITMLSAVVAPSVGVAIATGLMWQYGFMGWSYLAMMLIGWSITSLGITIGFHRLMSHRSFETYRWVRALWMCAGSMSVEGAPLIWCAVHRRHHSCSDKEGDPHSPNLHAGGIWGTIKGLWHSQIGWLFTGYWSKPNLKKYVPDLLKDRLLVVLNQWYLVFVFASLALPAAIGFLIDGSKGALLGFIWGGLVRVFWTHHITWSINSICHVFGRRDFKSNDYSTNNALCGILAWGEGWHNNHHAFPSSARHGLAWWQFDFSWIVIRFMKSVGLAWDIKLPSPRALNSKRIR